jgi:hypothetical protein
MKKTKAGKKNSSKKTKAKAGKKVATKAKVTVKAKATAKKKAAPKGKAVAKGKPMAAAKSKPVAKASAKPAVKAAAKPAVRAAAKMAPVVKAKVAPKKVRRVIATVQAGSQDVETVQMKPKARVARAGSGGGDFGGASVVEGADSESVDELLEEGQTFEAGVVRGVEAADDEVEQEVHTHEVPQDDVPKEYDDDRP